MPKAIQEIIDLIDMRIKIHTDALEIPYLRGKIRRKAKLEEQTLKRNDVLDEDFYQELRSDLLDSIIDVLGNVVEE